jgi:hypothetical protein
MKKKNCEHCKKEFEAKTEKARYCSSSCRARSSEQRRGLGNIDTSAPTSAPRSTPSDHRAPVMQKAAIPTPPGLDFATQMIFDMIKKESQRWEDAYNEQKKKNEKLTDEKAALQKEFTDFQHNTEKQKLIEAKPTGLGAIADSDFVKQLTPHLTPHIATFIGGLMNPELPQADEVALWLDKQPDDIKAAIRELLTGIATIADPAKMQATIGQLINVIQKGTTINPEQHARRTGTDGMGLGNF